MCAVLVPEDRPLSLLARLTLRRPLVFVSSPHLHLERLTTFNTQALNLPHKDPLRVVKLLPRPPRKVGGGGGELAFVLWKNKGEEKVLTSLPFQTFPVRVDGTFEDTRGQSERVANAIR